jgi:acylphosphatase
MDDGTVQVEAEGELAALNEFEVKLHKGSTWSKVQEVKAEYFDDLKGFQNFEIKYKNFWSLF